MRPPTFAYERALYRQGFTPIGVDEAGCGCLAGPVVAAALHLPIDSRLGEIRDSKLLSAAQRERLVADLRACGAMWAVGMATNEEIDAINIRQASLLAMRRAVEAFFLHDSSSRAKPQRSREISGRSEISPLRFASVDMTNGERDHTSALVFGSWNLDIRPFALVDAWTIPGIAMPQRGIIRGDRLVKSIAAASIIAKTTRDAMFVDLDREFPQYGFAQHKGYATTAHRAAIAQHGLTRVHRTTFCTHALQNTEWVLAR